jgi:GNAT superfamily N-acetyltransferase
MSVKQIVIRRAAVSEQDTLEALQWRASLANPDDRDALLANPDAIALPIGQIEAGGVWVAEGDGSVLGFAVILLRADGDAELDGLFVDPAAWRSGIGRALVEACCSAVRTRGAVSLHVVGNPQAEGFYRSCGFEKRGTQRTRFGVGLLMHKLLA